MTALRYLYVASVVALVSCHRERVQKIAPDRAVDKFEVSAGPEPVVTVSDGTLLREIDLRDDIDMCRVRYDHTTGETFDVGLSMTVRAVTADRGEHFVLLSVVTPSGCDVVAHCGGADTVTLVWLAIGADLSTESKQVLVVDDCLSRWVEDERSWDETLSLHDGRLTLTVTEPQGEAIELEHVTYDRRAARSGLRIER